MELTALSDDDLLLRVRTICLDSRRIDAGLIVHLLEVEERRLHLTSACSSLFDFCVRRLGMSEGAAFRRINAARLVRRFPALLGHLESGKVHLSTLVALRDHLTEANLEELVEAASGKGKGELAELLARRAPRSDVPSRIRKLPSRVSIPTRSSSAVPPSAAPGAWRARIEPLSEARYRVQLTASAALREKLERARDLMRHANPSGDLAVVVERAVDALLEKLERKTHGKTSRPRRTLRRAKPGYIASAVRREVFARDGGQCTFVDAHDRRCPARAFLEVDHIQSRARGGRDEAANLRVLCRAHNLLHAEEVFGRPHVARQIYIRQQKYVRGSPSGSAVGVKPSPPPQRVPYG